MPRAIQLSQNDVVQKSIRRLKQMGLSVIIDQDEKNELFVFVPIDDVLALIRRQMTFPNTEVDFRMPYIVVHCWREGVER